jgi:hypothetical protein
VTELRQRAPRQRDEAHLRYVRERTCCIPFCNRPSEAAHLRMACPAIGKRPTGMQEKPDDRWCTNLCAYHHRTGINAQHTMNEADFWQMVGLNPFEIATRLWIESGGYERAMTRTRPPITKRVKPRKPKDKRAKIPAGRPLRSRGFQKRVEHRA